MRQLPRLESEQKSGAIFGQLFFSAALNSTDRRCFFGGLCLGLALALASVFTGVAFATQGQDTTGAETKRATASGTPVFGYRVINRFPHDPTAFTQGLVYAGGVLYESTGLLGQSTLREVDLETGKVRRLVKLPARVFGEGLALWKERLVQLTWRSRVGFVFDRESFQFLRQFRYMTEGWGLAHDGKQLIMSDGSANLYFLDPETFALIDRLEVKDNGVPVAKLNELEFIKGEIFANVWETDRIARISPDTGNVLSWVDLSGLLGPVVVDKRDGSVLNGIAYDVEGDRLFVTGKRWPQLFEIQLLPRS